jgi:hypothetical protein
MTGIPEANTGKWAKAALKTTLKQALRAPTIRKMRAGRGQPSPFEVGGNGAIEVVEGMKDEAHGQ